MGINLFPRHYALLWETLKDPVDFIVPFSAVEYRLVPSASVSSRRLMALYWHPLWLGLVGWGGGALLALMVMWPSLFLILLNYRLKQFRN